MVFFPERNFTVGFPKSASSEDESIIFQTSTVSEIQEVPAITAIGGCFFSRNPG